MPTVISESDLFSQTFQRPNNGELADAASLLLPLQQVANRERYLYNRGRTQLFDATRAPFNANPAGTTDSTAAIQAADAAASATGGHVFLPAGSYRHDDSLHPSPGVSWFGVPDGTFLNINHATKSQLIFDTGSSREGFTEFSGIGFGALVDNTGNAVEISNDLRLRFSNCTWNDPGSGGSPKLKGRFLLGQGTGTIVAFDDCWMNVLGTVTALFLSSSGGELRLRESSIFMPATYTGPLVEIDDGVLSAFENTFDVTAHSGSADIIELISLGYHSIKGNRFIGTVSSGACVKTLSGGIKISETGSVFDTVNGYGISSPLAIGSELTLQNPIAATVGTSGTITCATGFRAETLKLTNTFGGAGPTIALPGILFTDQQFTLSLLNASGSSWSGVTTTGGIPTGHSGVLNGAVKVLVFRVLDFDVSGTPVWFLISERG